MSKLYFLTKVKIATEQECFQNLFSSPYQYHSSFQTTFFANLSITQCDFKHVSTGLELVKKNLGGTC